MVLALVLHLALIAGGLHRLSNDEAARVLMALSLTPANALEPGIWPPLHRIVLGLALRLGGDVFWIPRALTIALALALIPVLAALALRISGDRRVATFTALLAVVVPHRLVLGSVPLSDSLALLLVALAALGVLAHLQSRRVLPLLAGCLSLGLAEAVRYETCFFALCLGLVLAWRWWRRGDPRFATLAAAGLLVTGFPVFWAAECWAWYGSLATLGVTGTQFLAINGPDRWLAIRLSPIGSPLWQEFAWNPVVLLGLAGLWRAARRDSAIRAWALAFMAALPVFALVAIATWGIPLAASWRSIGAWSLLLLPFAAQVLVRFSRHLAPPLHRPAATVAVALLILAMLPPGVRDIRLARAAMFNWDTGHWRQDEAVGRAALAAAGGGRVVVDSLANLDFLDVMVGSGAPGAFVTSADAPPVAVGLDVPMREALRRQGEVPDTLDDHFRLAEGGDAAALAARGVGAVLVREAALRSALDRSPLVAWEAAWPDWALYRLRPPAGPPPD